MPRRPASADFPGNPLSRYPSDAPHSLHNPASARRNAPHGVRRNRTDLTRGTANSAIETARMHWDALDRIE